MTISHKEVAILQLIFVWWVCNKLLKSLIYDKLAWLPREPISLSHGIEGMNTSLVISPVLCGEKRTKKKDGHRREVLNCGTHHSLNLLTSMDDVRSQPLDENPVFIRVWNIHLSHFSNKIIPTCFLSLPTSKRRVFHGRFGPEISELKTEHAIELLCALHKLASNVNDTTRTSTEY